MNHLARDFSQTEASTFTGISQEVLRDWRRRGFLDGFGEAGENGRWKYSLHDMTVLAIVRVLEPNGQPISTLLVMAYQLVLSVIQEMRDGGEYQNFWSDNWAFWFEENHHHLMAPVAIRSLDDLAKIPSAAPQVIIVNSAKLAAALPERLQEILRDPFE